MELLIYHLILSTSIAMVIAHFRALPSLIYRARIMNMKPMNCEKCMAFWTMIFLAAFAEVPSFLIPMHGLAGMMAVILLINYLRS